jgi:tripartite-type tricarboxylate transporter receptor subunit TctC
MQMRSRRTSRLFTLASRSRMTVLMLVCAAATAQTFPNGQLRIVSPYPPGGGTDVLGRVIAQRYTERFSQPAIVDNRVGANGTIGTAFVAKAPPDGLTLLLVPAGHAANPSLYKSLPYDQSRDLAPVSQLTSGPLVLVVYPSLPVRSVKELIALARSRPGDLNFGSPGSGALPHLSAELFNAMAGTRMTHVPYKGPGLAVADLMSGQIALYFMNVTQALPLVAASKLRALGVTSPRRSATAPQIPTIAEQGLPGFDMTNWYGMLAPSATPKDTIDAIYTEVRRIVSLPDTRKSLADMGMVVEATTPEDFARFLQRESAKYLKVIQAAGIKGTL